MAEISGSIVTYGCFDEAAKAANSLLQHTKGRTFELFIVDNASPDGTGVLLKNAFEGRAKVLLQSKNVGFGAGHNKVVPYLKSRYHAVINPDIEIHSDVLTAMAGYLDEHPEAVAAVPKLLYPGGKEQLVAKRLPSVLALLARHIPFFGASKIEGNYLRRGEELAVGIPIEFCTGCFFLMRTEVFLKIGGFDERYFMYFEDVDIGREAMKYGEIAYLPNVEITHAWHRDTIKKIRPFLLQLISMFKYFAKWGIKWR